MAQSEILREYLVSLGFRINQTDFRRFDQGLGKSDLGISRLATRALGAATAVQALVAVFAKSMEKMYYASQRTEATVGNLQALEFAGKKVGVSGEAMQAAIEGLARSLRNNPGLKGLLHELQIPTEGRDMADVMKDLVGQLRQMPFYKARQVAEMFGMDETTYLMLAKNIDKFTEAYNLRKKMSAEAGLDADALARQAVEYSNLLDSITTKLGLLKDLVLRDLLPAFKAMAENFDAGLTKFINWWGRVSGQANQVNSSGGMSYWDFTKKFWSGVGKKLFGDDAQPGPNRRSASGTVTKGDVAPPPASSTRDQKLAYLSGLEAKFGLPAGVLSRIWAVESSEGKNMLSPKGAKGHFQFMDKTAKEWGLKDPMDFAESGQAAAKYLAMLLKRYGGNVQTAGDSKLHAESLTRGDTDSTDQHLHHHHSRPRDRSLARWK